MTLKKYEAIKQPPRENWGFLHSLHTPLYKNWNRELRSLAEGETYFGNGFELINEFADNGTLDTAYASLRRLLTLGGIPEKPGTYRIILQQESESIEKEKYRIEIKNNSCLITATDVDGMRRAIYHLEDLLRSAEGPYLKKQCIERKAFIHQRISRCFFGPTYRPPHFIDELTNDIDYYPDNYLDRLAHEGVNGLWISMYFRDFPSRFFPEHNKDNLIGKRLEKLQQIVKKCARYGIRIYVYFNEPKGFGHSFYSLPMESGDNNPLFKGHQAHSGLSLFCTSTEDGREYVSNCIEQLFEAVPDLGGIINITMGENDTNCCNALFNNNCPRCQTRESGVVFSELAETMLKSMRKYNPLSELLVWFYTPLLNRESPEIKEIYNIADSWPDNIYMMLNFESSGTQKQLGKYRDVFDYSLAYVGPSDLFNGCAKRTTKAAAKIQVACSHECASIPFIPVPGNLFRKYQKMHELGVSSVLQCWYFGNYPGLMNKAAGKLSFSPFPASEEEFQLELAKPDWQNDAEKIVKAWTYFRDAYVNFPANLAFAWYGPMHNAVTWPLYIVPQDSPIEPSWVFDFPTVSGDRIGECLMYQHSLAEATALMEKMRCLWRKGVEIMMDIEPGYEDSPDRVDDIYLAKAIGIQINSAYNVLKFYLLREEMFFAQTDHRKDLKKIIREEIDNSLTLSKICLKDSRLGYHSEAEGYKYFPEKLIARTELLQQVLDNDFKSLDMSNPLFPEYTGTKPEGIKYRCPNNSMGDWVNFNDSTSKWRSGYDGENIYFEFSEALSDNIEVEIEPCRLWPTMLFKRSSLGTISIYNNGFYPELDWKVQVNEKMIKFTIPFRLFEGFYRKGTNIRINIINGTSSWIQRQPLPGRLLYSSNPESLGWLIFDNSPKS